MKKTLLITLLCPLIALAQTPVSLENKTSSSEEVVKEVSKKAEKDPGQVITLEDGRVYRVFKKRPTELPPKGEIYIDQASFDKMKSEEAKAKSEASNSVEIVVMEPTESLPQVVEEKKGSIVIKTVKASEEEDPMNILKEEASVPLAPVAADVIAVKETPKTPVSLEVRSKMEELFDVGVSEGKVLTDEKTKALVVEEKRLMEEEIAKKEASLAKAKLDAQESSALESMQAKEMDLRKNAQLSEGSESPTAPASKEDLKTVSLSKKNKTISIDLPQPQNQERQNTVALTRTLPINTYKAQINEGDLLEEGYGFEEASGPEYGFGFEK